jgi:hypothetical protein
MSPTRIELAAEIATLRADNARKDAEIQRLREALEDLLSWFPEKPSPPEWRLRAGEHGADDAVSFARAALSESRSEG